MRILAAEFKTKSLFESHVRRHEQRARNSQACELCGKVYSSPVYLQKHVLRKHGSSSNKQIACKTCPETFVTYELYANHLPCARSRKRHACAYCDKIFARDVSLRKHVMRTHERKSLSCVCGRSFDYFNTLRQHQLSCGVTDNQHECPLCHKRYKSRAILREHLQRLHAGQQVMPCPHCGKTFRSKKHVFYHVRKVHPPRTDGYACHICKAVLKCEQYLREHMKSKHGAPFACVQCGEAFDSDETLAAHASEHSLALPDITQPLALDDTSTSHLPGPTSPFTVDPALTAAELGADLNDLGLDAASLLRLLSVDPLAPTSAS